MIAVVNRVPVETITVQLQPSQVAEVKAYLYSEFGIDASVKATGRGSRRRYHFGAERFSVAARTYLDSLQAGVGGPVADRVRSSATAARRLALAKHFANRMANSR